MMGPVDIATGLLWFLAFLFSTTVHEAMHALAAYRGGDPTAYRGGQVSLSPAPHMRREPIGMVVVPLLTSMTQGWAIGWASTPYDPRWAARYPQRAALMAAAGPAGNLAIALVSFVLIKVGLAAGWFVPPAFVTLDRLVDPVDLGVAAAVAVGLSILLTLNVLLCVFNLIPVPPLDGASVLGLFLPSSADEALRTLGSQPAFQLVGLLVAWQVFPSVAGSLFRIVVRLVHPEVGYAW